MVVFFFCLVVVDVEWFITCVGVLCGVDVIVGVVVCDIV